PPSLSPYHHSFPTRRSSDLCVSVLGSRDDGDHHQASGAVAMFAGIDFSAWNEVLGAWLTFRIAGADFDPMHSAILIAALAAAIVDRKSTRLNSSHRTISYAV